MSDTLQSGLDALLGRGIFESVPFNVAVIDSEFRVVGANSNFEEYFGEWRGRRCYEVYKNADRRCVNCQAQATFEDGHVRVSDETGIDRHGRHCHYVVHLAPLKDNHGCVQYILEMTTDLTEGRHWQREYDLLFERVPCYVLVIDRNFRMIRANEKFRKDFGEIDGKHCYEICKRRDEPCSKCPASLTFQDGTEHVSSQTGVHRDGSPAHYVVTASPLSRGNGEIAHVIEMAIDITPLRRLEEQLKRNQDFYESLVQNSATGILALDTAGKVRIANPAACELLSLAPSESPSPDRLREMLPPEFFGELGSGLNLAEAVLRPAADVDVPVRFSAVELTSHEKTLGRAAFMQDLRELRRLEQEKLEAERLGAVGQTVAGLAHTIKNLLMGLEGGMYMLDTGLHRGDVARIADGWQVLQRNFDKTATMVKGFLSFAKGRLPELRPVDPVALAGAVVELYREAAARQGVELLLEAGMNVREAPLDPDGLETCLTNLVSNGIDAAVMREHGGGKVVLRVRDERSDLIFEVSDNGVGMDQEVTQRIFTTFFTTKGSKGTGLGLLTTRKIVQEHGGRIETESAPERGSIFRIRLPRPRLQALAAAGTREQAANQVNP